MNCSIDSLIGLSNEKIIPIPSTDIKNNYDTKESEKTNEENNLEIQKIKQESKKILEKAKRSFSELEMAKKRTDKIMKIL